MTSYSEALKVVLDSIHVMETEEKPAFRSTGQILAEDLFSDFNLPQMNTSIPDGYALKSEDIQNASRNSPVTLNIAETVRAGYLPKTSVKSGSAARIMTGAVLPEGADCVVRFEDTDEPANKNGPNSANPSEVKIYVSAAPGTNVLKAGSNIQKGSLILSKGTTIRPPQISVLTSLGKSKIKVVRRPIVAVLSTGDELIGPGKALTPEKSYDSNSPAISALIEHYGGVSRFLGIASDYEGSIISRIRRGMDGDVDAFILSGGVSKGDYDVVRLALAKIGSVKFSRIEMGPGRSFAFGFINIPIRKSQSAPAPVFALSGPPAGCLINFETLVRPALLKMLGCNTTDHPTVEATALDAVPGKKPFAFVKWTNLQKVNGEYRVHFNHDRTGALFEMANANSLTIIPEETNVNAGDRIQVLPLDWHNDSRICPNYIRYG